MFFFLLKYFYRLVFLCGCFSEGSTNHHYSITFPCVMENLSTSSIQRNCRIALAHQFRVLLEVSQKETFVVIVCEACISFDSLWSNWIMEIENMYVGKFCGIATYWTFQYFWDDYIIYLNGRLITLSK